MIDTSGIQLRYRLILLLVVTVLVLAQTSLAEEDEPPLPLGLESGSTDEPSLPIGIDEADEPDLPIGLEGEEPVLARETDQTRIAFPFDVTGFWEARIGVRTQDDPHERDLSIGETRMQLQFEQAWDTAALKLTADFIYDSVFDSHSVYLETGQGWLDLRDASLALRPTSFADIKVGRQILTWGTGDLLFINDLFPKDWNAFFIGRDIEYLKAPSDAIKIAFFTDIANLDIVYTPRFDADRFIDGKRLSYWNASLGRRAGRDAVVSVQKPDKWLEDDEVALRLYKNVSGYELAAYAYHGFWKSPGGSDMTTGKSIFPDLSVYGASIRGPLANGIANLEFGYYESRDDHRGNDPAIRNSEVRMLLGYSQEIARDFTLGLQYYLEHLQDHGNYKQTLPPSTPEADKDRHVLTARLTKLLLNQNLELSLFTYFSPSDGDAYFRPRAHYKIDDHWSGEVGGNVFIGEQDHTFFGQFEDNTNIYAAIRYSF